MSAHKHRYIELPQLSAPPAAISKHPIPALLARNGVTELPSATIEMLEHSEAAIVQAAQTAMQTGFIIVDFRQANRHVTLSVKAMTSQSRSKGSSGEFTVKADIDKCPNAVRSMLVRNGYKPPQRSR